MVHTMADFEPIAERATFAKNPGTKPCKVDPNPYKKLCLGPHGPVFLGIIACSLSCLSGRPPNGCSWYISA